MATRLGNKPDLPRLMSLREFAAKVGRSHDWLQTACRDGRIPAAQRVAGFWIVPEDALIRPRYLDGIKNKTLIDVGFPQELLGKPVYIEEPSYKERVSGGVSPEVPPMIHLPSFERIMKESGLSRRYVERAARVNRQTQSKIIEGKAVMPKVAIKLAKVLGVDVEDLMIGEYDYKR